MCGLMVSRIVALCLVAWGQDKAKPPKLGWFNSTDLLTQGTLSRTISGPDDGLDAVRRLRNFRQTLP